VSVSVFQNRDDYGPRRLEIAVENLSDSAIEVSSAAFTSTAFATTAAWDRPTSITAGSTTNLRVQLDGTRCTADATASTVAIDFSLPDGTTGQATVTPGDPFGTIARIVAEDCAADLAQDTVAITLGETLRIEQRGAHPVALLDVTFTPTGAAGSVRVSSIARTILVRPASGDDAWPVGKTFDASSAALTITLEIVPANCRLHTVTEDKRGTYFPFETTTDDAAGSFFIAASTEVKAAIYAYIGDYCGWD
jgi:hypothetical protein